MLTLCTFISKSGCTGRPLLSRCPLFTSVAFCFLQETGSSILFHFFEASMFVSKFRTVARIIRTCLPVRV